MGTGPQQQQQQPQRQQQQQQQQQQRLWGLVSSLVGPRGRPATSEQLRSVARTASDKGRRLEGGSLRGCVVGVVAGAVVPIRTVMY